MSNPTRRDFLKTGALSTFLLGSGIALAGGCSAIQNRGKTKNVIFLVSDGMSAGTLTMADVMLRRRNGRPSNWIKMLEDGTIRRGLMDMASADRIVTDSAAAAASWGCGHRVNNGALNIGPDGTHYKPLTPIFRDAGKSTGLVTTAEITHATPAGFAVNMESRAMGEEIAEQYLQREVDFLLGGGNRHYHAEHREDGTDLYETYREAGYMVARTKGELMNGNATEGKVLGVFSNSHVPYTLDHLNTEEDLQNVPTLAEMTDLAIQNLSKNSNGFILQVEGGRVDHAAHSNDVGGLIFDQIAFDDAIEVAMDFAGNRDDTLVIITTDHGNANPGFNSAPDEDFDSIGDFRHTANWIRSGLNGDSSIAEIRERFEYATRLEMEREHAEIYRESARGNYRAAYSRMNGTSAVLGQILANYTHVNWVGGSHTADYVELATFGPGSEALEGFVINTQLFDVITEAAGVKEFISDEATAEA
ncbi:MAG: alkaline phosphatase [Balneolaceae bacterium]|nr:alkaline phosphatase [Balneolaceae bacterium]